MRIAAIRYISALPLVYGLQKKTGIELILDTPASCYQRLSKSEVDVALIPVFGTQTNHTIRVLKGLGLAAFNKTESVYVFAKRPLDRVENVLIDKGSITSAALLKIILKEKYRNSPHFSQFYSHPIQNIHQAMRNYDSVLVIGNEAILAEKTDYDHYDLATEWYSITRLPFVFAVWGSNRPLTEEEKQLFINSYREATLHWNEIYEQASTMLPVDSNFLKRYYTCNLHYLLTRNDYEGLLKFFTMAAQFQFIARVRKDIWL